MLVAQEVGECVVDKVHDEGVLAAGVATEGDVSTAHDEVPTANEEPSIPSSTPPTPPPQPSQDIPFTSQEAKQVAADTKADQDAKVDESVDIQGRQAESQAEIYKIDLDHANKVLSMQEDESEPAKVQEVVYVVTTVKLITEVVTTASTTIIADEVLVPAATTAAPSTLTVVPRKRDLVEKPKPLKKEAQIKQDEQYARELEVELNKNIDWDEVINHVKKKAKEDPAVKRYQALKRKPQTEAQAKKNMMIYLKNVAGFKMDYFKGMSYDDICTIFEAKESSKKEKLDEEVEELKRLLQIVPNEEDDVYTEATPLARKVPVVDYEIINQNNKPYYKIKRANARYTCLNLEKSTKCLWSSKSQELEAVGIMWCADNCIFNNTTDLLVERKYPLTRFTLEQMLNAVRLKVEDESEVSLELLRFIQQQHQEGASKSNV
nr:hypothetical protein [Tanacetum cinerariifolium]